MVLHLQLRRENKIKSNIKWVRNLVLGAAFCFAVCLLLLTREQLTLNKSQAMFDTLAKQRGHTRSIEESTCLKVEEISIGLSPLFQENKDYIGWLTVDGTSIDYPVMYTPQDSDFYLYRAFDKSDSKSGVPFIAEGCNLDSDNIIIYGHNMRNTTMFSELLLFESFEHWKVYPDIMFETLDGLVTYKILSAFYTRIPYKSEVSPQEFPYYNYGGTLTVNEFKNYVDAVLHQSLYDTELTAVYGDQLLTLSTCAYHVKNGRFVVVAKRIS